MKDNKTNSLIICRDYYVDKEEFENAVRDTIMLLLNAEYIMTVQYEEKGVVVVEYQTNHKDWGCAYPYWLYPEEEETVVYKED